MDLLERREAGAHYQYEDGSQAGGAVGSTQRPADIKQEAAKANTQGIEALRQGQHLEAVRHFQVALGYEPDSVHILNNIGLAYAKMQDFGSAYEWYEKAYRQDTSDVETLFSLAWVERKRQRFAHARELFQKVLDKQPDHHKALYLLGDTLKNAHDLDGAVWHFERLTRLDPHSVDGHVSLAQCYEQSKQYPRAAQLYNHVLSLAPGRTDVIFFLGRVCYLAKQYRQSIAHFDRVPDSDARAFEARAHAAKACREIEDHERAVVNGERAAHLRPHPDVMHFLGEEYLRLGNQQKASRWFSRARDMELHGSQDGPSSDERRHLGLRTPPEVQPYLPSDVRQREAVPDAVDARRSAQTYTPLPARETDDLLHTPKWRHGVDNRGEEPFLPLSGVRGNTVAREQQLQQLQQASGKPDDLERLLRRAERASSLAGGARLGGDGMSTVGSAGGVEQHWKEVLVAARSALRRCPDDALALRCAARALLSTGGPASEVREYARRAEELAGMAGGSTLGYELHVYLAAAHERERDNASAERHYAAALSSKPSDESALLGLARVCVERRDVSKASKLAPTDGVPMLLLGQSYAKVGRTDEAMKALEQGLALHPNDAPAMQTLADLYRAAGRDQDAIRWFKRLLDIRPGDYECSLSLARLHAKRGAAGASQAQLAGCTVGERVAYGELLFSEGKLRDAKEQLELALQAEPENIVAMLKLAATHRQEGNLEEARKGFEKVLQRCPTNAEALEGAASCHRKVGNLDQATQLYQQCLKVKSNAEGPLYSLGDILYRQHRHAECQHYLARLVETECSPDYKTGALYTLAKSHISLDEYEEAERYARAGLALKPKQPHLLFILAMVKNRVADFDSSIATLKQALQYCDQAEGEQLRVDIHDWLAQAYERKHEYSAAMSELDQALQRDPSHVSSLITRGLVHVHLKQLDQAETTFHRALAVEKNHALALVRLGYCKLLTSDLHEATQLFQRALQQRCGTVALPRAVKGSARVYLALSQRGQQDVEGALAHLVEARKNHRNFAAVCASVKPDIVKGETEGLVQKLCGIPDLDVNVAQAWQLVHLMAMEELESEARDTAAASVPGAVGESKGAGPAASPTLAALLAQRRNALEGGARGEPGAPASGPPPTQPGRCSASEPPAVPAPGAERRQWTAASETKPPERRQWAAAETVHPSSSSTAVKPPNGQRPLRLDRHEQIDYSELTQNECLGTGGFGAVYRGFFKGKEVAIKKLFCEDGGNISPLQLQELESEVASLRSLNHSRLVSFIGACLQPPNLCIVTEFVPGGSLHHLLHKAKTPLTRSQQAKMGLQICEGVTFLHSLEPPVVHRDLKSLNIVLDLLYNAKICDFGLTQSMEKTHISLKEGGNGGSPRYMAPECYDCRGKITEKVDVWAMGCILVEVFGGPLPYDDCTNIQQIVAKVLIDKQFPYIPHDMPPGARPIIEDCFHFDIKLRTTAQDVYSRLRALRLAPE